MPKVGLQRKVLKKSYDQEGRATDKRTRCVIQVVGGSNPDMRMDATRVHQIRCYFVDGPGADETHSHLKLVLNVFSVCEVLCCYWNVP